MRATLADEASLHFYGTARITDFGASSTAMPGEWAVFDAGELRARALRLRVRSPLQVADHKLDQRLERRTGHG